MGEINIEQSLFSSMYKYHGKTKEIIQSERRKEFIKRHKDKKNANADYNRCILNVLDEQELCMEIEESQETREYRQPFKYKFMLSEWFLEPPPDLKENWLFKLCPEGSRILVIVKRNRTICVHKNGKTFLKLSTSFPGGTKESQNGLTVFDCVYNKNTKTIFILDCLCWNSMSMLEHEAHFRFYWLESKFKENPEFLKEMSKHYFKLIDIGHADINLLQEDLMKPIEINGTIIPYDGVVFYYGHSVYNFGYTPLTMWLPSFMLTEKLGVQVDVVHLSKRPPDYVCAEEFMKSLCKKKMRKYKGKNKEVMAMESTDC
ncbi:unnamed protein product [Brassicogethes aeneus]|uniref:Snurportin-1 n=1 Tax=Brassicogethes aeneus TaxID=1431903 RepID=A0A9P0AMG2_BRAAE|nr:unnamed protein product [Brassicogethes aeneus]